MGVAISAFLAALAVVYYLATNSTTVVVGTTTEVITLLGAILSNFRGVGRAVILSADESASALFYSVAIYLLTFSASYFLLRFIGAVLLALGVPDEDTLRVNRQRRIGDDPQVRQAKLIAYYLNNENAIVTHPDRQRNSDLPRL